MAQFAEKLPYDELDPCCQRELDENTKYNEVTRYLRENDRSTARLDVKSRAVKSLRSFRCECCKASKDYPILAKLRALTVEKAVVNDNIDEESEEENDEDDLDLEYLTPYEIERMNGVKAHIQRLEQAKALGFATHVEDSVEHVCRDLRSTSTPIVLHLYDPNSSLCGELDLALEYLAPRYIGSKFRRIAYAPYLNEHPQLQEFQHVLSNIYASNTQHALICLVNKAITAHTYSFAEFSDSYTSTIIVADLEKYLDHAHVLASVVSVEDTKYYRGADGIDGEDEDEGAVEKNTFCDDPDCTRHFPHEHIGNSGNSASFVRVAQAGEEALAKIQLNFSNVTRFRFQIAAQKFQALFLRLKKISVSTMIHSVLTPPTVSKRRRPKNLASPLPMVHELMSPTTPIADCVADSLLDYCQPCYESTELVLSAFAGSNDGPALLDFDEPSPNTRSDDSEDEDYKVDTLSHSPQMKVYASVPGSNEIATLFHPSGARETLNLSGEDDGDVVVERSSTRRKNIILSDDESDDVSREQVDDDIFFNQDEATLSLPQENEVDCLLNLIDNNECRIPVQIMNIDATLALSEVISESVKEESTQCLEAESNEDFIPRLRGGIVEGGATPSKINRRQIAMSDDEEDEKNEPEELIIQGSDAVAIVVEEHNEQLEEHCPFSVSTAEVTDHINILEDTDIVVERSTVRRKNIVLSDDESDDDEGVSIEQGNSINLSKEMTSTESVVLELKLDETREDNESDSDCEDFIPRLGGGVVSGRATPSKINRRQIVMSDDEEDEKSELEESPGLQVHYSSEIEKETEQPDQLENEKRDQEQFQDNDVCSNNSPGWYFEQPDEKSGPFSSIATASVVTKQKIDDVSEPHYDLTPPNIRGGASIYSDTLLLLPEALPFSSPVAVSGGDAGKRTATKIRITTITSPSNKENHHDNFIALTPPLPSRPIVGTAVKPILKTPARTATKATEGGGVTPGRRALVILSDSEGEMEQPQQRTVNKKTPAKTPVRFREEEQEEYSDSPDRASDLQPSRADDEDDEEALFDSEVDEEVDEEEELYQTRKGRKDLDEEEDDEDDSFIDDGVYDWDSEESNQDEERSESDSESEYDSEGEEEEDSGKKSRSTTPKKGVDTFVTPTKGKGTKGGKPVHYSANAKTPTTVVKQFKRAVQHEQLVERLFAEYNRVVFKGKFPANMSITWNNRMLTTAGYCRFKNQRDGMQIKRFATIELSTKVLDSQKRLESTLLHELCHAATWTIDHVEGEDAVPQAHGKAFFRWGERVTRHYPHIEVGRCHSYQIHKKHRFKCSNEWCGTEWSKHSKKGVNIEKKVCGKCKGRIVYVGIFNQEGQMSKKREASGFSLYVKNKFAEVKAQHNLTKVSDVMKQLSINYKQEKLEALKGVESISLLLNDL